VGRERKQSEPDEPAGAPEWMVTFSDCMTLLLTFFVLLLSFSSFSDEENFLKLKQIFSKEFSVSSKEAVEQDAVSNVEPITYDDILNAGSEKPTLAKGKGDHLKEETESVNFRDRKVFLISSDRIFWGNGSLISHQGRNTLSAMSSFLSEVPNRVVISEGPQRGANRSEDASLERAWAVMDYLITERKLDKQKFSISSTVTTAEIDSRQSTANGQRNPSTTRPERTLEIVLLERSIYN
jgi:chemotaxis protein MotB